MVDITKSIDSAGQPQAFSRSRNGVSRLFQPGLARCLWLPRQVSIRMVWRGVFRIQVWMLITSLSFSPATCSGFIQPFWASKACWSNLGNMRSAAKPGPLISSTFWMVALPILRMPAPS
jgi:hypothetical protein